MLSRWRWGNTRIFAQRAAALLHHPRDMSEIAPSGECAHQEAVAWLVQRVKKHQVLRFPLGKISIAAGKICLNSAIQRPHPQLSKKLALPSDPRQIVIAEEPSRGDFHRDPCFSKRRTRLALTEGSLGIVERGAHSFSIDHGPLGNNELILSHFPANRERRKITSDRGQHRSQPADERAQGCVPGIRDILAPDRAREVFPAHGPLTAQHEKGPQAPALPGRKGSLAHGLCTGLNGESATDVDAKRMVSERVHACPIMSQRCKETAMVLQSHTVMLVGAGRGREKGE